MHILAVQNLTTLRVDHLTLLVVHLVIFQQVLTDRKVVGLDLLLSLFHELGNGLMLDFLPLRNAQCVIYTHDTLGTEETHQIVLQRQIELGMSRVTLTSGTSTQLIVDSTGFMTLGTDDLQTAQLRNAFAQLDIRTTAGHVRRNGYASLLTCIRDDLCLKLMILRIQYLVLDATLLKQLAEFLGRIDIYGTDQHRLTLRMRLCHIFDDGIQLLLLCLENGIVFIYTLDGKVRGDHNNVHAVDLTELVLLSLCGTGHAGFLFIFIKEVLEGNGRKSLGLPLNLYILLCLDTLMQTVIETTSRHDTSGELVNDQDLIILYHVILITMH